MATNRQTIFKEKVANQDDYFMGSSSVGARTPTLDHPKRVAPRARLGCLSQPPTALDRAKKSL
jgi:hypothetical protein